MSLFAQKHHNCPTCRCTDPVESPVQVDAAHIRAEALSDGPESLASLVHHLRVMADRQVDAIDSDRLMRAAALIPTPAPSPDVGELVERVVRAKDTAGAFSKIELTEILAGRTEVAAFCLMLDNHVFPAVIAALAKMKGGAE